MTTASATAPPVFVGGTGRSGTTIAGQLLDASPHYAMVPIELRLHVEANGLGQLAQRRVSVDAFEAAMRNTWYDRPPGPRGPKGVHVIIDRAGIDAALERLRATHDVDSWTSAGTFLHDVMAPFRQQEKAESWVEMTPPNAKYMHLLARMVPESKFLHVVRDGRDVAASVSGRWWGPSDLESGITWWGNQMMAIHRSTAATDPARVLTLRLESLVGARGTEVYEQLLAFLGLEDGEQMRAFLTTEMSMGQAQPGRWRRGLDEAQQERVDELYELQLARFKRARVYLPPFI